MKKKEILANQKKKQQKKPKSKLDIMKDELEYEMSLDQNELVDFEYKDRIHRKLITIHDKRSIKVALMDFEIQEIIQNGDKQREECRYNPKSDDPIDEEQDLEKMIEKQDLENEEIRLNTESKFVRDLEDALQDVSNKLIALREDKKKILEFFKKHFKRFTQQQLMLVFMGFFLELSNSEIAEYFNIAGSTIFIYFERIKKKVAKLEEKSV